MLTSTSYLLLTSHTPSISMLPILRPPRPKPTPVLASKLPTFLSKTRGQLQICRNSEERSSFDGAVEEKEPSLDSGGSGGSEWITSVLLFGLWSGLMYYVFQLAPNQTPFRDIYFVQKLSNLRGDDGFQMNEVLVSVWYIMGLWPLLYSTLLIPTGRSARSKIPVWPFLVLSCIGGAYALIPYFVLWRPPPPPVEEEEISKWPLNFLESKIIAGSLLAAGLGLIIYAGFAGEDAWKEYYQYFRESKFIHVMSLDFFLLSAFSPFWVYNDMTARRWLNQASWLLPVAVIPFVGPALHILLRPSLSSLASSGTSVDIEQDSVDSF